MSYVAIARKWRPSTFGEIVGQPHVTRTLENAIRMGRIHHAFLFTGARGVGKTTAARALARALNCEKGPTHEPCGQCVCCKEILSGSSPDVIEIDGASNNSVDDVRDLRETVRYLPQHGRYKIYIVDEVHMLTASAFNALLKTLEEPPAHVVFIFATTEPQKIPETILSRVQRFDFKRISLSVVVDRLKLIAEAEGVDAPIDALRLVARAGDGSMRDAQSLLDQVISFSGPKLDVAKVADVLGLVDRELLYAMLEGVLKGDADRCLEAIAKVYEYGYELSEFTSEMLELVRNATLTVLSPSSERFLDVSDEEKTRLKALTKNVAPEIFVRSFQVFLDVHEEVSRAPRPRLVLEMAVARLLAIRPARPIDDVVARLGEMERRLRHQGARPRAVAPPRPSTGQSEEQDEEPSPRGSRAGHSPSPASEGVATLPPSSGTESRNGGGGASAAPPKPFRLEPPDEAADVDEPTEAAAVPPLAVEPALSPPVEPPSVESVVPIDPEAEAVAPERPEPPPVRAEAPLEERYDALLTWLHAGGIGYDVWVGHSALVGVHAGTLTVAFDNPFTKGQAEARLREDDGRIRLGLERYFPETRGTPALVVLPLKDRRPTRTEAEATRKAEHKKRIEQEIEVNPLVDRIRKVLGGAVRVVEPDEGAPP